MIYVGAIAVAYALASLLWAPGGQPLALAELTSLTIAFGLGRLVEPKPIWLTLIGVMTIAIVAYAFFPIINPDYIACVIALALVASVAYAYWFFIPFGIFGLWYCGGRGAIIASGFGVGYLFLKRFPTLAICAALLSIFIVVRFTHNDVSTIFQRVGIWQDTINHLTIRGHGFGSFAYAYAMWSPHTNVTFYLPSHAYNDPLELMSDLGLGTILVWLFIALCLGPDRQHRAIFFTFGVLSLTYFPFWIPPCAQLAMFALGQLSKGAAYGSLETDATALPQHLTPSRWYGG